MIGRLNHVAIAVPDLDAALAKYRDRLGATVGAPQVLADQQATVAFVELENARLKLMAPLGPQAPLSGFLAEHPQGGVHHLCFEVNDLASAIETLTAAGARVLGGGVPRPGAGGLPVVFLHPADFDGTLIALEERKPEFEAA